MPISLRCLWVFVPVVLLFLTLLRAEPLPLVETVDAQPLSAQIKRLLEAFDYLGAPLEKDRQAKLEAALLLENDAEVSNAVQKLLDPLCIAGITINPESRVKVKPGEGSRVLDQGGWTPRLVKVANEAGVTASLRASSPQAQSMHNAKKETLRDLWLDLATFDKQPMTPALSGLELEYRILHLYSRDAGKREARISFDVGQGTQDLGFRNEVNLLFQCRPAIDVALGILDENGKPTVAAIEVRDRFGRVYPSQGKRLAPDFAFHPQVYRADGETVSLPEGRYQFRCYRGPESIPEERSVEVVAGMKPLNFKIKRWIDPSLTGWWSGDHHIHAAGCAHYTNPSEGVHAPDMMKHCLGEDLKIGANLTWGPCFDYQKQFFTGTIDQVSQYPYLLRYDVEVSGFGSHNSGHLCLLRLKEQMYPGGDSKHHWPTLCLNTLRWAKKQGGLVGPAHSGWGLEVKTDELPNLEMPPFDGIGANEYIVDVTHEVPGPDGKLVPAVDFISTVDTPYVWELNIWYHVLNAGYRTRISGETDFPCIYGERVGLGRSYVKLPGRLDYNSWCEGIRAGRNYVGDGRSHLLEFTVAGTEMGVNGSEARIEKPGKVAVSVNAAALLKEQPNPAIGKRPYQQQPYWHIERARKGESREVSVEILVNGYPVANQPLVADGHLETMNFEIPLERSSWVAARILPSSHTNPVFVLVDEKPIRASRKSVQWCIDSVEKCWGQKERFIAAAEMEDAIAAYDHARKAYRKILAECEVD